jgi:DNA-binding CsgD family transcriptional regulator/PAS domain-containing protein
MSDRVGSQEDFMLNYDNLVGSIYDCAANPDLWPEALTKVRDAVGGAYALAGFVDMTDVALGRPPYVKKLHSSWDKEWLQKLDVILNKLPDGGGLTGVDIDKTWTQLTRTKEAEFHKTDFYNNWAKPQGLRDTINVPYLQRSTLVGMLSIPCFATRDPYSNQECELIERISPHVRRAMLINDLTDKGNLALTLYREALNQLAVAVFIIGFGRRIIFANAAAEAMLSDEKQVKSTGGALCAILMGGSDSALDDAIDRAACGDTAIGISGIGVPLFGLNGERSAAYVLPIAGNDIRGDMGNGHCAVFISKRGEQQPIAIEILRTVFDLSPAEARISTMVAAGDGPATISASLGVSVNTIRSHLARAFSKTGTSDQSALGALVNKIIPPIV